jgi:hypothetical protein
MWLCAGHHPRLAPCGSLPAARAMRLTTRSLPAARAMRLTTRGLRHAAHGKGDFYLSHKRMC